MLPGFIEPLDGMEKDDGVEVVAGKVGSREGKSMKITAYPAFPSWRASFHTCNT